MQWEKTEAIVPVQNIPVLVSGYTDEDPSKKRWYTVAIYTDWIWIQESDGEALYTPTHWTYIKELK